ncbi:ABC transporter permease subunit [Glutamicibacter sp. TV12E]|uniref:ABC transporter permease subunit n=1 Tax=Glutamicibacter sp. TV12E TaxID=3446362 RepID=UPI0040338E6F
MRNFRVSMPAALLCAALLGYAFLVPALNPNAVGAVDLSAVYQRPGPTRIFGTDQLGRDLWVRTAAALRVSLLMALGSATFATLMGIIAATVAVTSGKFVDGVISRAIDGLNAIPHLLLSVVILALWPGQIWAIIISIGLTHWTQVARVVRAKLLSERENGYVRLSAASGASSLALWRTHLIPAILPQAGIAFALQVPHAMWHESALSFLGVGLPAQAASLGLLLEDARSGILAGAWWLLIFPSTVLITACWAVARLAQQDPGRRSPGRRRPGKAFKALKSSPEFAPRPSQGFSARSTVRAGEQLLVRQVEISAEPGTINVLMGTSGAGKTLFLRSIAGLLPDSLEASSMVTLNGRAGSNARAGKFLGSDLVFIPGSAATALNPVHTMRKALTRALQKHSQQATGGNLEAYWRQFGLDAHLLDRYPHQLSGGQAQRALLALGLAGDPACVVLDEPTGALDEDTRLIVAQILRKTADAGTIVLMVTHDLDLAEQLAGVIHTMEDGQLISTKVLFSHREGIK